MHNHQIKEEIIDGQTATVVVEIEVTDLKKSINDLVAKANIEYLDFLTDLTAEEIKAGIEKNSSGKIPGFI